jgi:hypothetical protein
MKYFTFVLLLCLLAGFTITQAIMKTKPKAKATGKVKLGGKLSIGGKSTTKIAAKPTGKVSLKLGGNTAAKPTGKVSLKLGGKTAAKPTGKVSLKLGGKTAAKPTAVIGKCPQAATFGMVAGPVRTFSKGAA